MICHAVGLTDTLIYSKFPVRSEQTNYDGIARPKEEIHEPL